MAKEKHQDRMMRESSFERDLKAKDRIRTVADLPWEREKGKHYHQFSIATRLAFKFFIIKSPVIT